MTTELRRGDLTLTLAEGHFILAADADAPAAVVLTAADLRWLCLMAGPALLPPRPTPAEILAERGARGT